jgi:cobalamin synthase
VALWLLPGGGFAPLVAAVLGHGGGRVADRRFHEDGLADVTWTAWAAAPERERALEIMKDSRIGSLRRALALGLVLGRG